MKLFTKGLLLVAVPGIFELVLLGLLFKSQQDATEAEVWAVHSKNVIIQVAEVREPLLLQSARLRRGIMLDDLADLDKTDLWDDLNQELTELAGMVSDNPGQRQALLRIRSAIADYREWSDDQVNMLRHGRRAEVIEGLRQNGASPLSSSRRLETIRVLVSEFIATEERLDIARTKVVSDARRIQMITMIMAVLGSIIAAAAATWIFTRNVGGRLKVLTNNARELSSGGRMAERVTGDDEISELDTVLHQTSLRLKQAESEARRYRDEIEQRARELAVVNDNLQRQTQDNEMFIYSVSHDLRSPLVNLQGFSKELNHAAHELHDVIRASPLPDDHKKRIQSILEEDVEVSLKFIRTAVTRSAAIIDAMLRLSRVGRVEYQPVLLNINLIVERVIDAMQGTIRERGASVTMSALPPCHGDPTAVEQIFGNLIGNAVNYLDANRPGKIEIGTVPDDGPHAQFHTYFIKDNGLGIPQAYLGKMFSAFHRLHANVAQGEGVGLALIKRIVMRHNGKIWVESEEGRGSTFYVSLPANAQAHELGSDNQINQINQINQALGSVTT
ncbi:histidine kinase [Oxalobacteraceae bacterium CAVE-383]|nr:histidine kinase [Oxalobacteraceae bacterium CAVE-383]